MDYTLTINGISVLLSRFGTLPERKLISSGETAYSTFGTTIDTGPFYEPKHIWTINAELTLAQYQALWAIFQYSDAQRRSLGAYAITLYDNFEPFVETTQTRAIAPGGAVTNFSGGVSYPATFNVRIFEPGSQYQRNAIYPYRVSLTLKELDKVVS